jgi:hypothetical protein
MSRKHRKNQQQSESGRENPGVEGRLQRQMASDHEDERDERRRGISMDGPNLPDPTEASNRTQDEGKVYDL